MLADADADGTRTLWISDKRAWRAHLGIGLRPPPDEVVRHLAQRECAVERGAKYGERPVGVRPLHALGIVAKQTLLRHVFLLAR